MPPLADGDFMQVALAQARAAAALAEVPVGAVVVRDGQVIATGANAPIGAHDPSAHAEIVALRAAAQLLGNYRLNDCELFVTLEPCAMCAGAILQARLKRLVFGAHDPKAGAAGSVLDLFANRQLNHQTQVQGGLLQDECAVLLQDFFLRRREQTHENASPLREDALRTPGGRFAALADYPWAAHYVSDLPSLEGLRLHYLDEGPRDAQQCYLCLHDATAWSYVFREQIATWLAAGHRVVAADLIGFGMSDKPKKDGWHDVDRHCRVLSELAQRIGLQRCVLLQQNSQELLGPVLAASDALRYIGIQTAGISVDSGADAYTAPFPDRGHQAGPRAFTRMALHKTRDIESGSP
jgi:tRNA(adenine34) deaminase